MTLDLENYLRICQSSADPYETVKNLWAILENIKNTRDAMDSSQQKEQNSIPKSQNKNDQNKTISKPQNTNNREF